MPRLHLERVPFFLATLAFGATNIHAQRPATDGAHTQDDGVREVLAVFDSLKAAAKRRDRAALERVYDEQFMFVHGGGGIVTRAEQIGGLLTQDSSPCCLGVPAPMDRVHVFGDAAILRTIFRNPGGGPEFGTYILVRRGGRWRLFQEEGTALVAPPASTISVDARALDAYVGRYERSGAHLTATRSADSLYIQRATGSRLPVAAIAPDVFQDRFGAEVRFERDSSGRVLRMIYKPRPGFGDERVWIKTS